MSRGSKLSRLGVLAPAALSACMDASVMAVPAAGAIVSTVLKELSKAFMLKKWFHGVMSAKEAENLIMEKGRNGSFLVRESQTHPGEYVLSVRVRGRVIHVMIRHQHDKYDVGNGEQFDDLVGLIEHLRSYPMIETSGDILRLLQPVSGSYVREGDIAHKVKTLKQSDESRIIEMKRGCGEELQSLWSTHKNYHFTTNDGKKPENICKNRYNNILPYDSTRVVLRGDNNPGSDYINANFISNSTRWSCGTTSSSSNDSINSVHSLNLVKTYKDHNISLVSKSLSDEALRKVKRCIHFDRVGCHNSLHNLVIKKTYIATQGCLSNTINDFWKMLWQQDVRVIAMITNLMERGKKKCECYWPRSGEEEQYANLTVRCLSEVLCKDYVIREFMVKDEINVCRTLYQYQFTAWPDHSVPNESGGILSFIEDINKRMYLIVMSKDPPSQNILCVHCSAGVGRTGTFIVIDMLIDKIKSTGSTCHLDISNTVKLVRLQRNGMVQNKAQYKFIYLALQDYIESKNFVAKDTLFLGSEEWKNLNAYNM